MTQQKESPYGIPADALARWPWIPRFLLQFEKTYSAAQAMESMGYTKQHAYQTRAECPEFADAWRIIDEKLDDVLEESLRKRAAEGFTVKTWRQTKDGKMKLVRAVQKPETALAIFMAKVRLKKRGYQFEEDVLKDNAQQRALALSQLLRAMDGSVPTDRPSTNGHNGHEVTDPVSAERASGGSVP